ncbi:hypothetical protein NDU88_010313 [Pleurodeles waltl]|uniref:Uncharacterized protein n=1 Tax=Pleurodeles waltl TaxID=8319 RepID=A0AAV7Q1L0_PLEWA|nr:hypothetical protein NDU88_010313 [Pleurodeles waltl]
MMDIETGQTLSEGASHAGPIVSEVRKCSTIVQNTCTENPGGALNPGGELRILIFTKHTHAAVRVCLLRKSGSARNARALWKPKLQRKRERSRLTQNLTLGNNACRAHAVTSRCSTVTTISR